MPPTLPKIAESKRICEAATDGPWRSGKPQFNKNSKPFKVVVSSESRGTICNTHDVQPGYFWKKEYENLKSPNAEFIAHARKMLPEMLKLVRETLKHVGYVATHSCNLKGIVRPKEPCECHPCSARRLIGRMEEEE